MTRTALYRLYSDSGELLYVGISGRPWNRFLEHRETKAWWYLVARADIEWHPREKDAAVAEVAAITTELPRYNQRHAERLRAAEAYEEDVRVNGYLRAMRAAYADALARLNKDGPHDASTEK